MQIYFTNLKIGLQHIIFDSITEKNFKKNTSIKEFLYHVGISLMPWDLLLLLKNLIF